MTKNQFREFILNSNIDSIIIISYPDYNGGRQIQAYTNKDKYDIELKAFEYVEYESEDKSQMVKDRNRKFFEHFEPQYEEAYDIEYSLQELLLLLLS